MEGATHNHNKKMKAGVSGDNEGTTNSTNSKQGSSISVLGSNSTKTQSASSSADPLVGFIDTNNCVRSVLMHPICFPLLNYLNDLQKPENAEADAEAEAEADHLPAYVWTALAGFTSSDDCMKRENVFAATALDWGDGETDFTKKLLFNINCCKIGESLLATKGEIEIGRDIKEKGKVDIICHKKYSESSTTSTSKSSVVALFEFGLENSMWWKKQDQTLKYVKILLTDADKNYKIDQPVLLSVITINKESKSKGSNIKVWAKEELNEKDKKNTLESNLKRIAENKQDIENTTFKARFGVFLCIRKASNKFRIALLWRHDTKTLRDASTQFGKVLYAVQLCSHLSVPTNLNEDAIQYKYLGPNCCKIGDLLFRSYDNRLRPTDRRPDLYLKHIDINGAQGPIAKTVLKIDDRDKDTLDFGIYIDLLPTGQYIEAMNWLWMYQGKLLVISTPYHDGVHNATRPHHFLPIIDHLEQLHSQGFVHGDIRAYNMVLQYDTTKSESDQFDKGWLIDFDYGGEHNVVLYPKGYKDLLYDGRRPGREGNKITIMDDWKSLIGLILYTYSFVDKEGTKLTIKEKGLLIFEKTKELESYFKKEVESNDALLFESDYEQPAKLLRNYINYVSDVYDVEPMPDFKLDLIKCGFLRTSQSLNASQAATGSPPKA